MANNDEREINDRRESINSPGDVGEGDAAGETPGDVTTTI